MIAISSFPEKSHLPSRTIRCATRGKILRFPRKYSPYRCFTVQFPGQGRFDRTIFRYCRYLRKPGNDFFYAARPADSRRSYYDPSGHGTARIVVYRVSEIAIAFTAKYFLSPPYIDISRDTQPRRVI